MPADIQVGGTPRTFHTMRKLRIDGWSSRFLSATTRPRRAATGLPRHSRPDQPHVSIRWQSSVAAVEEDVWEDGTDHQRFPPLERISESDFTKPSPSTDRALGSAKLAALHARLALPQRLPLQTLARALVDASADDNAQFNNANLAFLGHTVINYHVAEWLMCRFPRLPMDIFHSAMNGYAGHSPLHLVARSWGIDAAAAPGGEVDPGMLQFSVHKPGSAVTRFGRKRSEAEYIKKYKWRRGISSRVVFDDDFGEQVGEETDSAAEEDGGNVEPSLMAYGDSETRQMAEMAYANAVRAVTGAVYAHCGREKVKSFIRAHLLSRALDMPRLFSFQFPTRELKLLCDREDFEAPVARLLSETGRMSRTPVYVVGIFSGKDKLSEGAGPNLDHARIKAAINALKAWYLYSPGTNVRVPSDMLSEGARPWEPAYIDIGEIASR